VCPFGCGVGYCVGPNQCSCVRGYTGQYCDTFDYFQAITCPASFSSGCGQQCPSNTVEISSDFCRESFFFYQLNRVCQTTPSYYGGCCPGFTGSGSGCNYGLKYPFSLSLRLMSGSCSCVNGACIGPNVCRCHPGFVGVLLILDSQFPRWGGSTCSQRMRVVDIL
jgi:hypothetical protein